MFRAPRAARGLCVLLATLGCQTPTRPALPGSTEGPGGHQILWQRTLDDALALARAEDRPLFIAVNMDGESASDRIVRENYRDPAFVAATRSSVCLVASVFRHTPRDHDEHGRRIPCPRLGWCTCGEHMALEPVLYEKYLADGERVAPRHALILPDGKKAWDLSLAFDLHDIDRALFASAQDESERRSRAGLPLASGPASLSSWSALAASRDQLGREGFESELARVADEPTLTSALDAVAEHGDDGSAEALRILALRLPSLSPALRERFLATVKARKLDVVVAGFLRGRLQELDALPGDPDPSVDALLPVLAELDGADSANRSLFLACRVLAAYGEDSAAALTRAFDPATSEAIDERIRELGGPLALRELLQAATTVARSVSTTWSPDRPRAASPSDWMPEAAELEQLLNVLDARMREDPGDPELWARYAKASLDLGRRRLEAQQNGAQDLLEDAEQHLRRALEKVPERSEWWNERARTAYFLGRFAEEAEYGRRAFALAAGAHPGELPDETRLGSEDGPPADVLFNTAVIESLRWIGDGDARLLGERAGQDPVLEAAGMLEGLRALGIVAVSPLADAQDWLSFASFAGALGLWREEFAIARVGVLRLPAARELRQSLNDALWNGGRLELAPVFADAIIDEHPSSADAWWFAGHAWVIRAEYLRRAEDSERALAAYAESQARFHQASSLRADYADNCRLFVALGWLGRGFCHVREERRAEAAECLVQAVTNEPRLEGTQDGLGYDVLDLVDKIFEWREPGPSPVDPLALLDGLEEVASGDPFWAVAISDSQLREALRADGRNPDRAERDTVDAAGNRIRMLLGLPDEEGDGYLRVSIAAARRALANAHTDEDRKVLAQSDTIWAERMLDRGRLDGVREALAEAAPLLGLAPPAPEADAQALRDVAAQLRALLGEARPRLRAGR